VCRGDDLKSLSASLRTRLAAAETRIRELEGYHEASQQANSVGWEDRCRTAEYRIKELEEAMIDVVTSGSRRRGGSIEQDELLNLTSEIADLVKQLQAVENVLEVTNGRARTMRSEVEVAEKDVWRHKEEARRLREQLRDNERQSSAKLQHAKSEEWFGWNEIGMERLVNSMHNTMHAPATVKQQCAGLVCLATRSQNSQAFLCERGAAEALVSVLKTYEDAGDVQVLGFAGLAALAHASYNNSRRIGDRGGIEVVLAGMRLHIAHVGVSEQACWTLLEFAANNEDNRKRILDSGGIGQVVAAMRTHKDMALMQETGCAALAVLVYSPEGSNNLMKEQGCIEAVVSCMQAHHSLPMVQEQGCKALASISSDDALRLRIGDVGGIEVSMSHMLRVFE